jgi:hypothetical protein
VRRLAEHASTVRCSTGIAPKYFCRNVTSIMYPLGKHPYFGRPAISTHLM